MTFGATFSSLRCSLYLEGSGKLEDMGQLMHCLYRYWYHKGYWGVISSALVDCLNTAALVIVAVIFTMRFRWDFAVNCSEAECASQSLVGGVTWPYVLHRSAMGVICGIIFLFSSLAAFAYESVVLVEKYFVYREVESLVRDSGLDTGFLSPLHRWEHDRQLRAAKTSGHEAIGLRRGYRQALATMSWGDFLEQLCTFVSQEGRCKFCDNGRAFDALVAVQTLMQRENYLIAFYDSGLLDSGTLRLLNPDTLTFVVDSMFDPFNTLYGGFSQVKERVVQHALLHLVLFPFFAMYVIVKVLVKNAAQFKSNYREFSQKQWNNRAQWTFRLYNEVEHLHKCRLANGRDIASAMVDRLAVSNNLSRLMRRISSSCVLVTAVISFLNPALLISGYIAGLSLVWWLTIALFVYSIFGETDPREREYLYSSDLERLIEAVHFADNEWFESGEAFYNNITTFFLKSRILSVCADLVRSICGPVTLLYSLHDGSLEGLLLLMRQNSITVDGVGSVITDSAFEDPHGHANSTDEDHDDGYDDISSPDESRASLQPLARGLAGQPTGAAQCRKDKQRQSIASFAGVYPQWTLQHVERPPTADGELRVLLQTLHHDAQEELQARSSLQASWIPDFSARSHVHREEASAVPQQHATTTGHAREQLYVSQLQRSGIMRSEAPASTSRLHTGYGTGFRNAEV